MVEYGYRLIREGGGMCNTKWDVRYFTSLNEEMVQILIKVLCMFIHFMSSRPIYEAWILVMSYVFIFIFYL